jgi:hypothetical protein
VGRTRCESSKFARSLAEGGAAQQPRNERSGLAFIELFLKMYPSRADLKALCRSAVNNAKGNRSL